MNRHNHVQGQTIQAQPQPLQSLPLPEVNPLQSVLSHLIATNADPKTLLLVANAMQQQQQQPQPAYQQTAPPYYNAQPQQSLQHPPMGQGYPQQNPYAVANNQQQGVNVSDLLSKLKGLNQPPSQPQQYQQQQYPAYPPLQAPASQSYGQPRPQSSTNSYQGMYNAQPGQQAYSGDNKYTPASSSTGTQDLMSMLQNLKKWSSSPCRLKCCE